MSENFNANHASGVANAMNPVKKSLTPEQFVEVFSSNYDQSRIYYIGDGKWIAKAMHGQLTKSDGTDFYDSLPGLLADLAAVGIRRMEIEWDGLPKSCNI